MTIKLDSKGRLTIPTTLVKTEPGDRFEARFDEDEDANIMYRIKHKKENWLEVLKQCPSSMDDLPPRSRELPKKNCELYPFSQKPKP